MGLYAAAAGGALIGLVCAFALPLCDSPNTINDQLFIVGWSAVMGLLGSVIDSILGALLQATPFSKEEKKVVEVPGGEKPASSANIANIGGWDVLDNNQVNFAMTFITSFVSMGIFAWLSH